MSLDALEQVRGRLAGLGRAWTPNDVADALRQSGSVVSDELVLKTVDDLRRSSVGAGPLDALLRLPGVTDVLVNGPDQVWIDRGRGLELTDVRFRDDGEVRRLATRLAASVGRRLDDGSPWVDARLADGTRVHAVLDALASPGTCISLRVPGSRRFTLADLEANGAVGPQMSRALRAVVARRLAFLVSGGTGSGKTTLLAALLALVPEDERLVVVEDSRELDPRHAHVVRLEGRVANSEGAGRVTLTDLVRQSLRMRPDRLVLGEVRGAELCDLLLAMNTGHEGGCATVHANSAGDVPARLEALAALGGMGRDACHAQVVSAVQLVVHVERASSGREVRTIGVVVPEAGGIQVLPALERVGSEELPGPGWDRLAELLGWVEEPRLRPARRAMVA